ncbi:hypothetical protein [Facklamia miroungae]|uniref:Uncharacterized protein n=1 Tax=Facklamia miroungae TaxID=120956 RepID=A0A1G7V493_9LACT|nr:hypothetical protein [Facklamia miroungae]NKZ30231.1 hypothetical protein [Facklamia miroungae]SDG54189.1 hypothetical protein SAMN05421791_11415 [Facklamia miroungae]
MLKSSVESYFDKEDILVPKKYLQINTSEIQNQVRDKMTDFRALYFPHEKEISENMILSLGFPSISCLEDLEKYFFTDLKTRFSEFCFYDQLLPYLLTFYAETSQTIINQNELTYYQASYQKRIENLAESYNMTFSNYVYQQLHLVGDPYERINERANEEFIFRLIAEQRYSKKLYTDLQDEYESFIYHRSLSLNADPIDLKEDLSLSTFEQDYSMIYFTHELMDFYLPKFEFISPN